MNKIHFKDFRKLMAFLFIITFCAGFYGCGSGGGGVDNTGTEDQGGGTGTGEGNIPIFWTRLGGNAYSEALAVRETSDKGFIGAGFKQMDQDNFSTACLVKEDSKGNKLWETNYHATDNANSLNCVLQTSDGGFIAGGIQKSVVNTSDNGNFFIIRTGADGVVLTGWPKVYSAASWDGVRSICESRDQNGNVDGFVFVGSTEPATQSFYIAKIDLNGNLLWQKIPASNPFRGWEVAFSIAQDENNGFIIAGVDGGLIWVDRIAADGNPLSGWPRTYGEGKAFSVKKTPDGGFILTGCTSGGMDLGDVLVIKADAQGQITWRKTFGGNTYNDAGSAVDLTSDGGYIIAGITESYDPPNTQPLLMGEVYLIRLDAGGNPLWQKVKGRSPDSYETATDVQTTSDGGYVIAGGAGGSFLLAKFDGSGNNVSLGANDMSLTVTATNGTINSSDILLVTGRGIGALDFAREIGAFALDLLIDVSEGYVDPHLNVSSTPVSIAAGKTYTLTFNNYVTSYSGDNATLNGSFVVKIDSKGPLADGSDYTSLTVSSINMTHVDDMVSPTAFTGSLIFSRTVKTDGAVGEKTQNTDTGTLSISRSGITETIGKFTVRRTLNTSGVYNIGIPGDTMQFEIEGIPGIFELSVLASIAGTDIMSPDAGTIKITADDGSTVTVTITSGNALLEVDTDANGTVDSTRSASYDDLI